MFLTIEIPTDSQCFAHNFVLRLLGYSQFFSDKEEPSAFAHQHTDDSNIFPGGRTTMCEIRFARLIVIPKKLESNYD